MTKVPAGLADASASSLATFIVGVVAVRLLPESELGAYALILSALLFAASLPTELILVPAEARLVRIPTVERASIFRRNVRLSLPWVVLSALGVLSVSLLVPSEVPQDTILYLTASGALATSMFPLQAHARRLLHLARRHWAAARVSMLRLAVTAVTLIAGWTIGLRPALLPFGALAASDAAALAYSYILTRSPRSASVPYSRSDLVVSGKWLLLGAALGPAARFAVSLLVTHLASAADLGISEAARVAASPLLVLAVGLSAVLRPGSMEAAISDAQAHARRLSRQFRFGLGAVGLVYLASMSLPEAVNPVHLLIPKAFLLPGLAQLSVIAAFFNGAVHLQRAEIVALDRTRQLSHAEALASSARTALAFAAGALRAWTVPLGLLIGGLVRWWSFARVLRSAYSESGEQGDGRITAD